MRRILFLILYFSPIAFAAAQAVSTRNNYTGFWTDRASWNQDWAGIANPTPLPVAQVSIYGYVVVGTQGAGANIELPASASSTLTVNDTLRIHGNLIVGNNAHLIVEASGVLIIHGAYNQYSTARLTNKGKIVSLGDFTISQSAGLTSNTGSIYVGGRISPGAKTYTSKTLSTLATEDPVTNYFSTTNVTDGKCEGNNSGTLTFSGTAGSVVRWESSTDYFKNDIKFIDNTTSQQTYTNLLRSTSYRVYYDAGGGTFSYSNGATVVTLAAAQPGTISGPTAFCIWLDAATFTLANNTGTVNRWEWSIDDFATPPQTLVTSSQTLTLTDLNKTTAIRAVVEGCGEYTSNTFIIKAEKPPYGGTILGATTVCSGTNSGTLQIQNSSGPVLHWESSTDGFNTKNVIANTTTSQTFTDLSLNTAYRAVLSNPGSCTEAYTNAAEVRVIQSLDENTLAVAGTQLPANGLMAHYPFVKNANDASGNSNHGIVLGATPTADRFGRANNAYSFDGVDDVISTTIPFPAPGPNHFTMGVWFKTTSTTGGKLLGAGVNQFGGSYHYDRHLYLSNTGQLHFGIYQTHLYPDGSKVLVTPQSYNDGVWHHAVATLSDSGMKLYVDGVLLGTDTRYTFAEDYSGYWKIGFDNLSGWPSAPANNYFTGALDDVLIYNRELTDVEISQLYGGTAGPFCAGTSVQLHAAGIPGATYSWTGPADFTSSLQNPLLTAVQPAQAGTYSVAITLNSCVYTASTTVAVPSAGLVTASQSEVCAGTNAATLQLSDHAGDVLQWESSIDNFVSDKTIIANTTTSLSVQNLVVTTSYRALIKVGSCESTYSGVAIIQAVPQSKGGTISGPATVCKGTNSGTLSLAGYEGSIQQWEYSDDGFVAHNQPVANVTTTLSFSNLGSNRWYRAVVKSGICDAAYSAVFQVSVSEVIGGTVSGPIRVCESSNTGTVQLQDHTGTILRWEWSSDGFQSHIQHIIHTQASYTFSNLTGDTWFRAVLGNAECADNPSAAYVVRFDQLSLGGTLSGTSSVCNGTNTGSLTLASHRGQILRWEYSNDNFATHTQAVANTSTMHTFSNLTADRWYRAVVQNGSCALAYSPSYKVTVTELTGGTLGGTSTICQNDNSGLLTLQGYTGTINRWESSNDNFVANTVAIAHTADSYSMPPLTADTWFRVVVGQTDCGEALSSVWKVAVSQPSQGGELLGETSFCSSANSGTLQLQNQQGSILRWEASTDGFVANIQPIANTAASYTYTNLAATTTYRAVVQNGSCPEAYSAHATITIAASTQAGAVSGAAAVCPGENSGTLILESKTGQVIRWESSTDGFATSTPLSNTTDIHIYTNLMTTTAFRAVVQNGSCDPVYSQVATITILGAEGGSVAGSQTVVSEANASTLQLQNYRGQILYWQSTTDNFVSQPEQITNTTDAQAYLNLSQTTWYRAVLQEGDCGLVYSVPAKITVNHAPLAQADTLLVQDAFYTASVSVLANDGDPDGDLLKVLPMEGQTTANGFVRIDENGLFFYEAPKEYFGFDSFTYTVCDAVAGATLCAEATVVLDLALQLVVYQGVSPNDDGENDFWYIGFIERYPENTVQLYDRQGTLVYETRGYDNQDNTFTGLGNKGFRPGGNQLPEGTYFYKITTSGKAPMLQGYIVLKK